MDFQVGDRVLTPHANFATIAWLDRDTLLAAVQEEGNPQQRYYDVRLLMPAPIVANAPHSVPAFLNPTYPFNVQIGGNHYKKMPIQPVEYCHKNGLGFCESSAIKYISRWRAKGGMEDLRKAIHFLELLIQFETDKAVTQDGCA